MTARNIVPTRNLKTEFSLTLLELEKTGVSREEIAAYLGYRTSWDSQIAGGLSKGEAYCGSSAGLINEILPAATVIQNLVDGYERISGSLFP